MTGAQLDLTEHDGYVLARVRGEIDAANADGLGQALEERVDHRTGSLVVDLGEVSYIDSAGVHLLFRLARRLDERSRSLQLVVPAGSIVEDTLRYADALTMLQTRPTLDDAIRTARTIV